MIFFDLESTGADPHTARITQIGARRQGDTPDDWHEFEALVNPGVPIPPDVAALTGITDERVRTCQPFSAIAGELASFLASDPVLVGFNCLRFDVPLLAAEFERAGIAFDWNAVTIIDVHGLESAANPRTLSAVYSRLFLKPLAGAHGAMVDAIACHAVFNEIRYRYPTLRHKTPAELALLSNHGRRRADPAGKLGYDALGRLCYAFGQYRDTPVADNIGYAQWMLRQNFQRETLRLISMEIDRVNSVNGDDAHDAY